MTTQPVQTYIAIACATNYNIPRRPNDQMLENILITFFDSELKNKTKNKLLYSGLWDVIDDFDFCELPFMCGAGCCQVVLLLFSSLPALFLKTFERQ